ncbi:MAG: insulinase family protein [Bacilli bacterium]|nr:insulinase family protein [Bacilli bacterium]
MKKSKLEKLDLELYEETLDNGLRVFVVPKDNVNGFYATLSTKFGSINDEFIPNGESKMKKVPLGVAHFLEHKMFEQKDGKDPFTFYSERGCDSNANTSNIKTTYLFSGSNSFEESLNYLLDYVQDPYFTDENVEKEKGIIEQEIKMYADEPFFKIYDGIVYNSFIKHPIKFPIAGTVKDVYSITKEDLYICYNTFYHPSNMFLVITGNVDPKETINLIKINQEKKKFDKFEPIKLKEYDEPNTVEKKQDNITMDIEIEKVGIGYKIDCSKINKNINDIKIYLSILFDLKLGSTSELSENLKNLNLITHDIDVTLLNTDKHILAVIIAETSNTNKTLKLIEEELKDLSISEEDFERKKKIRKSGCIYRSDSIYSINNKIIGNIMSYDKVITDDYKKIDELNIKDMKNIIKKIDLENKTVYIINKS